MKDNSLTMSEPLIIEKTLDAPVKKVWAALTELEEIKQWYFDMPAFMPEVGFEFTFKGENEGRVFIHHCKILEVVPEKKLKHTWSYEGYPGMSYVTFELSSAGLSTLVRLTHEGLETFPSSPDF
ncbi:MAG TPA: SRPBCC domain-containing protein, partial [Saprospiraceae bacterium]|nr:SRPBCC domain-containing protein [Saprospiraceae bacterium]